MDRPQLGRCHAPYLCVHPGARPGLPWFGCERLSSRGGAWARSPGLLVSARALSLISVHDPGLLWAGDMMVDRVIPLGKALRPLGL